MADTKKGIIGTLLSASFLLVLAFILLYLYWNASALYKQEVDLWQGIIGGYLITLSLMLVVGLAVDPETIQGLAKAPYWKNFGLRFIPSAIVTLTFLVLVRGLLVGGVSVNPLSVLSYVPLTVLIVHIFVVTQVEEIMNGILYNAAKKRSSDKTANRLSIIVFSLFHFAKSGGSFVVMATYVPLRWIWNYLKQNGYPGLQRIPKIGKLFGPTPNTQQTNAGSHLGWNAYVLGFIR